MTQRHKVTLEKIAFAIWIMTDSAMRQSFWHGKAVVLVPSRI